MGAYGKLWPHQDKKLPMLTHAVLLVTQPRYQQPACHNRHQNRTSFVNRMKANQTTRRLWQKRMLRLNKESLGNTTTIHAENLVTAAKYNTIHSYPEM